MTQVNVTLPRNVFENTLSAFIETLSIAPLPDHIVIDFTKATFYIPSALVALIASIRHWLSRNIQVTFIHHKSCEMYQYLQRMDFFSICGLSLPETFNRHAESGKFMPITEIGPAGQHSIRMIAKRVADCLAPELRDLADPDVTGFYDFLEYAISELALNVVQHSQGRGFICVQFTPKSQLTRIGICDNGIGIRKSFEVSGSPHFYSGMTDKDAILRALQSQVSSKNHLQSAWNETVNAGVGLTILEKLTKAYNGYFAICSGNALYANNTVSEFSAGKSFYGTFCSLSFNRQKITNFFLTLNEVKDTLRLGSGGDDYLGIFS